MAVEVLADAGVSGKVVVLVVVLAEGVVVGDELSGSTTGVSGTVEVPDCPEVVVETVDEPIELSNGKAGVVVVACGELVATVLVLVLVTGSIGAGADWIGGTMFCGATGRMRAAPSPV